MNLVALLILPAVISLRDNDAARYAIAGVALVILAVAVAYSKRQVASMADAEGQVEALVPENGVDADTPHLQIALEAIDRWIYELGDEEKELRSQLRTVKEELASGKLSAAGAKTVKAASKRAATTKKPSTSSGRASPQGRQGRTR